MESILDILENTEKRCAGRMAVDDGKNCVTWETLGRRSREFGTVIAQEIPMRSPVMILARKSITTLAAMLGCVYAGGFYVMADPELPADRLREMIAQVQPQLVVTEPHSVPLLRETGYAGPICLLKEENRMPVDDQLLENRRKAICKTDLLYVLFTSGSTGKPKGISVSHQAVIKFIRHFTEIFDIRSHDRIGNQAPFDFDVSVKDIYSCLMTGASLILIPNRKFSTPSVLLDDLCEKKVTVLIWAVSALTTVSALKGLDYRKPVCVRKILFSGEVMPPGHLARWRRALPETEFINLYGPSEITCNCTYYRIPDGFDEKERLPIGKPFPGREVFLLGEHDREIRTAGETGEICVAGESLADGYYGNQEETNRTFLCRLFRDGSVRRYYKTGDLGYISEDGTFFFQGRKDFQVKHMGHRIELEEIERILNRMKGIEKSCCLMDQKRNRLIAFYTGNRSSAELRELLKEKLPVYMIPQVIRKTAAMPLNKNGKTDRSSLMHLLEDRI